MKKVFEVEKCECGKISPVDFNLHDSDGGAICPDCAIDYLKEKKREVVVKLKKEKEIYQHAHTQDELLIRELWTLWENLAEAGELTITSKFATKYNELKAKIK